MKVRSITIGMGRTYRGPIEYEAYRIDGAVTVDLEEGESAIDAARKSFPILREQMRATYREFKPQVPKESKHGK